MLDAHGQQIAVVAPVEKILSRRFLFLTLEIRNQVVAVEMNLEVFPPAV